MAPRDYTILGDWATTPPGLLVMLPGGLLASTSDGLPLGLGLSGPGCHPCNSGDGEWVEHCERSTWQAEIYFDSTQLLFPFTSVLLHLVDCP